MRDTGTSLRQLAGLQFPLMKLPPLRISYMPVDPDNVPQPVVTMRMDVGADDDVLPMHWHRKGQLVFAEYGSAMCRVENGLWIVPSQGAMWVPGGVPHNNVVAENSRIYCVFIDPGAVEMPKSCCLIALSPLIREIIFELSSRPPLYTQEGPTARLARVLLDELLQMRREVHYLPISADGRLRQISEEILDNPADRTTLTGWARRLAMSERSLARLVLKETGMTFGRWRRQMHLLLAIQRLSAGDTVQSISTDLGYESASAFIAMFRKAVGVSPGQYLIERNRQ